MLMNERMRPLDSVIYSDKESAIRLANMLRDRWSANQEGSPYLVRVEELLDNSGYKVYLYFKKASDLYDYRKGSNSRRALEPVVFDLRNSVPVKKLIDSEKSS